MAASQAPSAACSAIRTTWRSTWSRSCRWALLVMHDRGARPGSSPCGFGWRTSDGNGDHLQQESRRSDRAGGDAARLPLPDAPHSTWRDGRRDSGLPGDHSACCRHRSPGAWPVSSTPNKIRLARARRASNCCVRRLRLSSRIRCSASAPVSSSITTPTVARRPGAKHTTRFLQVAAELGLVGLFVFLTILSSGFAATRQTWLQLRGRNPGSRARAPTSWNGSAPRLYSAALLASLSGWLLAAIFGSVAYYWTLYIVLALAVTHRDITARDVQSTGTHRRDGRALRVA